MSFEPVLDENGEPVIDPITEEPMVTMMPVFKTLEQWRATNALATIGMTVE